jgi:thiol reductant ABC exporter CydC subunit
VSAFSAGIGARGSRRRRALALWRVARLRHGEGRRLALTVILGWATVISGVGLLTASGYLISRAAQRPLFITLMVAVTTVRAFGLSRAVFRYLERLASHDLALRVLARLRTGFYAALAPLGARALEERRRGDLLARFVADVDSLQDLYLRALAPPLVALLVILTTAIAAAVMLPAAGLVLAACLVAMALLVPTLTAAAAAGAGRRQAPARARLADELLEALEGSVELALAGRAQERAARIDRASQRLIRLGVRDALVGAGATTLQALGGGVAVMAVLIVAIPAVRTGALSAVLLAAVVLLTLGALEGLAPLPLAARRLSASGQAASRLADISALEPAVSDPPAPRLLPAGAALALRLEHVSVRFSDGTRALDDVSLTLEPGARVALTGPSGAGKTTLAELLVRFADPQAGTVMLGGIDLRELALDEVRASVVLIAQDAHVFTTSVRENLLLARREACEAELWAALRAVALDEHVRSLPAGLDELVGEDGGLLSGGQRQRLTVARALVSDARFIVLDEPTSQLDGPTAAQLIEGVAQAAGDRGLLVITHRSAEVAGFDTVYELRNGRLASATRTP